MNNHIIIGDDRYVIHRTILREQIQSEDQLNAWLEYNYCDKAIESDDKEYIALLKLIPEASIITEPIIKKSKYKQSINQQKLSTKLKNFKHYGKQIQRTSVITH